MVKNDKNNAVEETFLNCSLDDLVAKEKKNNKKGKKGFKKSWNKRGRGGYRGRGRGWRGRGRGRGRGRRGRGGKVYTRKFQQQMKDPMNRLQQLAQTYNLMPTIAVLKQNNQGVEISIEMDISQFEKKPAGAVVLRQIAWGTTQKDAKVKAVKEILKHKSIKKLSGSSGSSAPLFPQKGKKFKKKNQKKQQDGEGGTWISASCFFNHPNVALTLFEKFCSERGSLVEYKESGDYPDCKVECVIDGNTVGTGTAKGKWTAKKYAIKQAYFAMKNADKGETDSGDQKEGEQPTA